MTHAVIYVIAAAVWLVYAAIRVRRSVHMLQLNSYMNDRFYRYTRQNFDKILPLREWIPLAFVIPLLFGAPVFALILWCAAYAVLFLTRSKEKEKKSLVYTPRVKRLFTTIAILAVIVIVIANSLPDRDLGLLLLFVAGLMPFLIVFAANTINAPIEKGINQRYLNDARQIVRSMRNLLVIGITGSYGKTSVKHYLNTVLAQQFNVLMTPESFNTPMGVTRTVRSSLRPTHDIFIAEMGAKQTGDIKELCDLAQPKMGIITSIGPQHLETFKTLENVQATKFELVESLPADGTAFLNYDDPNIASYTIRNSCKVVKTGIRSEDLDYRACDISISSRGTRFRIVKKDGTTAEFETVLLGEHNIYNILSCAAVGSELGIPLEKLASFVKKIKPVPHRLELKKNPGNITILDDAFNSNPVGANAALDVLGQMAGQKILITPGMIELGDKEYELNHAFAAHAAEVCDYIILVGTKQTIPLQDALKQSAYPESKYFVAKNLNEALQHLQTVAAAGSIVLLENDLPDNYNE